MAKRPAASPAASVLLALALLAPVPPVAAQAVAAAPDAVANRIDVVPADSLATRVAKAARIVPTARQLAWQRHELIAFIHFNMPTFIGAEGGDGRESPARFAPSALDPAQWARVLRENGIGLAILTVKHADGFLLYPSKYSDHGVMASPYKQDLLRLFVAAMRREGIGVGLYFSPLNRHMGNVERSRWDPRLPLFGFSADKPDRTCAVPETAAPGAPTFAFRTDEYNCLYMRQLYEVFSGYGPIDEWWIDGNAAGKAMDAPPEYDAWRASDWPQANPERRRQRYDTASWYQVVKALQPQMLSFNGWDIRWPGTESGIVRDAGEWSVLPTPSGPDSFQPELIGGPEALDLGSRQVLADSRVRSIGWYPAEADTPILASGHWFHRAGDAEANRPKSPDVLWQTYTASVGRNAVLLLNLSPDQRGRIPDAQVAALRGLHEKVRRVFGTDLARDAHVSDSADGRTRTLALPHPITVDWISLQEDIARSGQRIEAFEVQAEVDGRWRTLASGQAVGYKRLLALPPTTARRFRVVVTQARARPALAASGLHREAQARP